MDVAVDGDRRRRLDRCPHVHVAKIEPQRVGVELEGRAMLGRGGSQRVDVGAQPVAAIDDASGGVPQHVHERMLDCRQQPPGGRGGVLPQR